jgi:hypothetical protein
MKANHIILLFAAIVITFSSCELEGGSNYTPDISFYAITNQNNDTLQLYYTDVSAVYKLDTIHVGDTITFKLLLDGFTNNLTSLSIVQSADSCTRISYPETSSMDSLFLSSSEYQKGKFLFQDNIVALYLPFKYIPLKESNEAYVIFTIVSDADFSNSSILGGGSNTTQITLKTPIK